MTRVNGGGTIYRRQDGRYEAAIFLTDATGARRRIRFYAANREEAEAKLVAARAQVNSGIRVAIENRRLGDYLDYWLNVARQTRRPTTYQSYESIVRNYLKPSLGKKLLTQLSVADVQRYLDTELAAGRSVRTVQKQRTVLSAALTRAQREELITRNVARLVEIPEWHRQEITPWSVSQLRTFLLAAADDALYPVFLLLASYGLRIGEVLGLQWEDVDLQTGQLRVRHQLQRYDGDFHLVPLKTKAGRRDLPLLPHIADTLLSRRMPRTGRWSELVFATAFDNPLEKGNVRRSFRRVSLLAGLPVIKVHHLRHTTATLLKDLGVPSRDIQLILGHANINTTQQLYQHASPEGHERALTGLQDALNIGDVSDYCRQKLPSKDRRMGDYSIHNSGSGDWTRTSDPRLMRSTGGHVSATLTEVLMYVDVAVQHASIGAVAVNNCRQDLRLAGLAYRATELRVLKMLLAERHP